MVLKILAKKIRETLKLESILEYHFVEQNKEGRKPTKTRVYAQKPQIKIAFKNFILLFVFEIESLSKNTSY